MDLPEKSFDAPAFYSVHAVSVMRQIEKDFRLQGIDLVLPENTPSYAELVGLVEDYIRHAELLHNPKFIGLLYQLDINEGKMRKLIKTARPDEINAAMAIEIVKRCTAKIYWRNAMK